MRQSSIQKKENIVAIIGLLLLFATFLSVFTVLPMAKVVVATVPSPRVALLDELPPCPTAFTDVGVSVEGTNSTPLYDIMAACGAASLNCDPKFNQARVSQYNEYQAAKTKCEAVQGCELSYTIVTNNQCACDPNLDCLNVNHSNPNLPPAYNCKSHGAYNLDTYTCARHVTTPPDPQ